LKIKELKVGSEIEYTGELIVMRDAAQKRIKTILEGNLPLPFDLEGKIVFYAGPAKAPEGRSMGSIGPTTSTRMDSYLEMLLNLGVIATVGKGRRNDFVRELCKKYSAVYFIAPSGAAAALSQRIISSKIIAFHDLGPEAVYRLKVKNFPLIVAIDSDGNCL